jgi:hypothetical protein
MNLGLPKKPKKEEKRKTFSKKKKSKKKSQKANIFQKALVGKNKANKKS